MNKIIKQLENMEAGDNPECKEEIDFLKNWESGENEYIFDKEGNYEGMGFSGNGQINDFECPMCNETLFTNEEEAIKFLNGE